MRFRQLIAVLLLALLAMAPAEAAQRSRPQTLTILYFNDLHGHLEPWKKSSKDERTVGGIARLAALVRRIEEENRKAGRPTILLEAGDVLQGTPMSTVFRGEPDIAIFNRMGVDAMTLGNHEFDFGQKALRRLLAIARFPVVSGNIFTANGKRFVRPVAILRPAPGLRIGVVGLTTQETPASTFPTNVAGLRFEDPVRAARPLVAALDRKNDLVVALTHLGIEEDRRLAREVPNIDVIVGGHNHLLIEKPEIVNDTIITQANEYGLYLGRLDLKIENGRAEVLGSELIPIDDRLPEDPTVAALVRTYAERLDDRLQVVVGRTKTRLEGDREAVRTRETNLGNFVADLMRGAARTDIALLNSGGVRASIDAGPITLAEILTAFPFDNKIYSVKLPGSAIRAALDQAASLNPAELPGGFLQVSGLSYTIENGKAVDILVAGKPLEEDRVYSVAMTDFTFLGGDNYTIFKPASQGHVDTGLVLNSLIVERLRGGGEIDVKTEGRITKRS